MENRAPLAARPGSRSYVPLPKTKTRHLRLSFAQDMSENGVAEIIVKPAAFSRNADTFFHVVAAEAPRGRYPRYWLREQSYWTLVGHPAVHGAALMNEEGMAEVGVGSFVLEPFLWVEGRLFTWADAATTPGLEQDWMPAPNVRWELPGVVLCIKAWMSRTDAGAFLHIVYEVENPTPRPSAVRLFLTARPYQVTPPWQSFRQFGGVFAIRDIAWKEDMLWVNGVPAVAPLVAPDAFGAAAFEQGTITEFLSRNSLPVEKTVEDDSGWASGAMAFDLELPPLGSRSVEVMIPFSESSGGEASQPKDLLDARNASGEFSRSLTAAVADWDRKLGGWKIQLPDAFRNVADVLRTAAAHILVNRDGAALQPGPRRYTRSWIRDGAGMTAALLRAGITEEAFSYLRWYAKYIRDDGMVPCCVDHSGPDWLPEYDSQGQFIFAVAECHRLTRDDAFLSEFWPVVCKVVRFIDTLRHQRLTAEYSTNGMLPRRGLLPESASHEGYLSHPVHSYLGRLLGAARTERCGRVGKIHRSRRRDQGHDWPAG